MADRNDRNVNVTPQFVLGGEATFTVSNGSGRHFTYHVYRSTPTAQFPTPAYFIKALTGPDNNPGSNDWAYLGMLMQGVAEPTIKLTSRSKLPTDDLRVTTLKWALRVIWQQAAGRYQLPLPFTIKHVGRCGRCGRPLTTPASIDTGFGGECASILGIEWGERQVRNGPLKVASAITQ